MTDDLTVEIALEDPRWQDALDLSEIADRAVRSGLEIAEVQGVFEVSILAADDARIKELNASFRDKPTPTNVLSWPAEALQPETPGKRPTAPTTPELGDIALAFETCRQEAADRGVQLHEHVTHLVLHGVLHLLGYDHEEDADATLMEELERRALARLGVADPY